MATSTGARPGLSQWRGVAVIHVSDLNRRLNDYPQYLPGREPQDGARLPAEGGVFEPRNLSSYAYAQLAPVVYIDPNGRWSSKSYVGAWHHVHQDAIQNALRGSVSARNIRILQQRQVTMDEDPAPAHQHSHAMWDATNREGITRAISIRNAKAFVRDRLKASRAARAPVGRGTETAERPFYENLGDAIHTMQDATSPFHRGFHDWGTQDHVGHATAERNCPAAGTRERIELEGATRWASDIAKGKAEMPEQFFDPNSGLLLLPPQCTGANPARPPTPEPRQ